MFYIYIYLILVIVRMWKGFYTSRAGVFDEHISHPEEHQRGDDLKERHEFGIDWNDPADPENSHQRPDHITDHNPEGERPQRERGRGRMTDVNNDGRDTALDALMVINRLRRNRDAPNSDRPAPDEPRPDERPENPDERPENPDEGSENPGDESVSDEVTQNRQINFLIMSPPYH